MKRGWLGIFILMLAFISIFNIPNTLAIQPNYPSDWYCGDMHVHSAHSDSEGASSVGTIMATAKNKNLDWIFLTEHSPEINHYYKCNTCYYKTCRWSWCPSLPYPCNCGTKWEWNDVINECEGSNTNPLCVAGVEQLNAYFIGFNPLKRLNDHYLAVGAGCTDDCGIDTSSYHNCGTNLACISSEHIKEIKNKGGLGIIAHSGTWLNWDLSSRGTNISADVGGIEIWNGESNGRTNIDETSFSRLLSYYNLKNNINQKVPSVLGNSDMCDRLPFLTGCGGLQYLGEPRTCCRINSLSKNEIFSAINQGKCEATNGPLLLIKVNGKQIGESADVKEGNISVVLEAYSYNFGDLISMPVSLYYNGNVVQTINFNSGECQMIQQTQKCSKTILLNIGYNNDALQYLLARMQSTDGKKKVITDPIWLNVTRVPQPPQKPIAAPKD